MSERGDGGRTTTTWRHNRSNTRDGGTRTKNMKVHVRHRAHVPITDGLIEGSGILQRSEGRAAVGVSDLGARDRGRMTTNMATRAAATRGVEEHVPRTCRSCSSRAQTGSGGRGRVERGMGDDDDTATLERQRTAVHVRHRGPSSTWVVCTTWRAQLRPWERQQPTHPEQPDRAWCR